MFEIGHSVDEKMKSVAFLEAMSVALYFRPEMSAQISPGTTVGLISSAAMVRERLPKAAANMGSAKSDKTGLFIVNSPRERVCAAKSCSVSLSQVDGNCSPLVS